MGWMRGKNGSGSVTGVTKASCCCCWVVLTTASLYRATSDGDLERRTGEIGYDLDAEGVTD